MGKAMSYDSLQKLKLLLVSSRMNLGGKMKEENGGLRLFLRLQIPRKGRWAEENEK